MLCIEVTSHTCEHACKYDVTLNRNGEARSEIKIFVFQFYNELCPSPVQNYVFIHSTVLDILLDYLMCKSGFVLQWTAERDMIDTCFICSRSSYDFEHHGQASYHTSLSAEFRID